MHNCPDYVILFYQISQLFDLPFVIRPHIKHAAQVKIPGKDALIYKSTLVTMMNENPKLSQDRYDQLIGFRIKAAFCLSEIVQV